jgi:hypothetical protein
MWTDEMGTGFNRAMGLLPVSTTTDRFILDCFIIGISNLVNLGPTWQIHTRQDRKNILREVLFDMLRAINLPRASPQSC